MKRNYKPNMYYKDVFSINYSLLKKKGITCLLFDLDNTLATIKEKEPNQKVMDLIDHLKKDFRIFLFSNAMPHRAKPFCEKLGIEAIPFANKPYKSSYLKLMKKDNFSPEKIAAIGDQIFTDIKGANRVGITSILVDPISKKDAFFTIGNRIREKRLFKKWENKNIAKKGNYYE